MVILPKYWLNESTYGKFLQFLYSFLCFFIEDLGEGIRFQQDDFPFKYLLIFLGL